MADLTPEQEACLRDLAKGPLMLCNEWESAGERRMLYFYSRVGAGRHIGSTLCQLAVMDLIGFKPPEYDLLELTDAGRAAVAALPAPACACKRPP